jgi:hypothetical protein
MAYVNHIPWYLESLLVNTFLKPFNIFVMVPDAASTAQLEALSRQVTATLCNPPVIIEPLSKFKPLQKKFNEVKQ